MTPTPPSADRPTHARVRYGPGSGTAVAGPGSVGLVEGTPDDHGVSTIVDALLSGADIDDLLECLAAVGIRSLPGFAIAFVEGDDLRLLIRGATTARVLHDVETTFEGTGTTSWFETVVASGPLTMRMPGATADRATFVLVAGSAPAAVIDFDPGVTAERPPPPECSPPPASSASPTELPETRETVAAIDAAAPVGPGDPGSDDADPGDADPGDSDPGDLDPGDPVIPRRDAPFTSAAPVEPVAPKRAPVAEIPSTHAVDPPVAAEAHAAGFAAEDIDYGHLLGATVYRTVEAAAVRPDDEVEDGDAGGGPRGRDEGTEVIDIEEPPTVNPTSTPLEPSLGDALGAEEPAASFETRVYDAIDPPLPAPPDPAAGLISAVPGMAGTRAEEGERFTPVASPLAPAAPDPAPVRRRAMPAKPSANDSPTPTPVAPAPAARAAPAAVYDDEEPDSHTISVADLRARQAADGAPNGTTVQAVHCTAMHPNPPHSDRCRSCDAPILDHSVRRISRPSLGDLYFDDGQIVPLDRPVVVGRKPAAGAIVGGEAARAVRLSDPDSLLSRTHLEVRLVDWQVQIVDRDSMNHTFVTLPGKAPNQLRPAEPFPIPPDTIVRLGDAATFTYKVGS